MDKLTVFLCTGDYEVPASSSKVCELVKVLRREYIIPMRHSLTTSENRQQLQSCSNAATMRYRWWWRWTSPEQQAQGLQWRKMHRPRFLAIVNPGDGALISPVVPWRFLWSPLDHSLPGVVLSTINQVVYLHMPIPELHYPREWFFIDVQYLKPDDMWMSSWNDSLADYIIVRIDLLYLLSGHFSATVNLTLLETISRVSWQQTEAKRNAN